MLKASMVTDCRNFPATLFQIAACSFLPGPLSVMPVHYYFEWTHRIDRLKMNPAVSLAEMGSDGIPTQIEPEIRYFTGQAIRSGLATEGSLGSEYPQVCYRLQKRIDELERERCGRDLTRGRYFEHQPQGFPMRLNVVRFGCVHLDPCH